jgi:hypothetical protein
VLAGDWTKNGIDGGCVEAAATSGIQAARALTGAERPVIGEDPTWVRPAPKGLPRYVEFGGRADSPGPFLCREGVLRGLLLKGERRRMQDLVRRTLTEPAGGAVEYRLLGDRVLLLTGRFGRVSSTTRPYSEWGGVREVQASFWIPVLRGRTRCGVFVADGLCLAVPHILVDNPMSYLGGREDYGYAKTMGRFDPEDGLGPRLRVEAYGGNFAPGRTADWHPFLDIKPAGSGGGRRRAAAWKEPGDLVRHLAMGLLDDHPGGELTLPDARLGARLVADLLEGRATQVFLKQFRDVADGTQACYQAVVEAPLHITRVSGSPSTQGLEVTIHPLDSHPIADELGVTSQVAPLGFELRIDFVVEAGSEVGGLALPVAGPTPAPAGHDAAGAVDGAVALLDSAVRLAWRELRALGRGRWW